MYDKEHVLPNDIGAGNLEDYKKKKKTERRTPEKFSIHFPASLRHTASRAVRFRPNSAIRTIRFLSTVHQPWSNVLRGGGS